MAQSHIPQPNSGDVPGMQIASTDAAPPASSIETTAPTPPDLYPAMGEFNTIDQWFYVQERWIRNIEWTTSDHIGRMLWHTPINPLVMDANLAHICKLYNAWIGSFQFCFKICGTGFHAGMITFVKTPPNLHPSRITNPALFSTQPWNGMDPKMIEMGSIYGRDIRQNKFHYMQASDNVSELMTIGGWLALFVNAPLSTSSSGVPHISIAVWVKCAPDFRVSWMLPIGLNNIVAQSEAPCPLPQLLDFTESEPILASMPAPCDHITIRPKSVKVQNIGIYNCFSLDGRKLSKFTTKDGFLGFRAPVLGPVGKWQTTTDAKKKNIIGPDPFWQYIPTKNVAVLDSVKTYSACVKVDDTIHNDGGTYKLTILAEPGDNLPVDGDVTLMLNYPNDCKDSGIADNEYAGKSSSESFLTFTHGANNAQSLQTSALAELFSHGVLSTWIPVGQAALFQLEEVSSGIPLAYVKLYREGFFTTAGQEDQVQFEIAKMKLTFMNMVEQESTFPVNASFSSNFLLASMKHERRIRNHNKMVKKLSASTVDLRTVPASSSLLWR